MPPENKTSEDEIKKVLNSLSLKESKILKHLYESQYEKDFLTSLCRSSGVDKISTLRVLKYLENKNLLKLNEDKKTIITLGVNGLFYRKRGLPERRFLTILEELKVLPLEDGQKKTRLSSDEFKVSLGILKKKGIIEIRNKKIFLQSGKDYSKKSSEELFLENLPANEKGFSKEQRSLLKELKNRKKLVEVQDKTFYSIEISDFGKEIIKQARETHQLLGEITPELLKKNSSWKGKKFRIYDVTSQVPSINGGKKHFITQSVDYTKKIWLELGFKEMTGDSLVNSFWNFDALFTPQDHPVREMQDTFFIDKKSKLPNKNIVSQIKKTHEEGIDGSHGWGYKWDEEEAKKMLLRTHTTVLSSKTLSNLDIKELPKKFFAIGRVFRNETLDWKHGFEFNQTEGIVIDENANFRNLLGYLKKFAEKMGLEDIRFRPAYFPYTEPSVEGDVWDEERKEWVELFAAGMLRPEVVIPLLGKNIPVLAWGPGIDRIILKLLNIKDMRDLYKNNLTQLRETKFLMK